MRKSIITNSIINVDQFGSCFHFPINGRHQEQKTLLGAIITIIIYSLGLSYFLYLAYILFNGDIPPNISYSTSLIKEKVLHPLTTPPLAIQITSMKEVCFIKDKYFQADPQKVYFVPKAFFFKDTKIQKIVTLTQGSCEKYMDRENIFNQFYCPDLDKLGPSSLLINPQNSNNHHFMQVVLTFCTDQDLEEGQICATKSETQEMIKYTMLTIVILLQEYDHKLNEFITTNQVFYKPFQLGSGFQYYLKLADVSIDNNLLFQKFNTYSILSDVKESSQQFDVDFIKLNFEENTFMLLSVMIDSQKPIIIIQARKISQILAEFSSIFNALLLFGYIGKYYSKKKIEKNLLERINKSGKIKIEKGLNKQNLIYNKLNVVQIFLEIHKNRLFREISLNPIENILFDQIGYQNQRKKQKDIVSQSQILSRDADKQVEKIKEDHSINVVEKPDLEELINQIEIEQKGYLDFIDQLKNGKIMKDRFRIERLLYHYQKQENANANLINSLIDY